jgi:hypothetical protein
MDNKFDALLLIKSKQQQGPFRLLHETFNELNWTSSNLVPGALAFQGAAFHLLKSPASELMLMLKLSWKDKFKVHLDKDRHHVLHAPVDIESSLQSIGKLGHVDHSLIRAVMTLKDHTGRSRKHYDASSDICKHCGQTDSWKHRLIQCTMSANVAQDTHHFRNIEVPNFTKFWVWSIHSAHHNTILNYLSSLIWV